MKIAFLIPNWPSLREIPISNQLIELNKAGHEANTILSFNTKDKLSQAYKKSTDLYGLRDNVIYIPQPKLKSKNRILSKLIVYFEAVPHITRTLLYSPRLLYKAVFKKDYGEFRKNFKIVFAVQNLLGKDLKFDIIHANYTPFGVWASIFKDLGLIEGKIVCTFHGYGINDLPKQKPKDFYNFLIKSCKTFTSNTNFTKQNAIALGFPEEHIHIIRAALLPENYNFKIRSFKQKETFNILTVAELKEVKGLEYAIKAAKLVKEKMPKLKFKYNVAGHGPLKEKLLKLIQDLDLESYVKLTGFINHHELKKTYDKSNLFILPSITTRSGNQEAQGLVIQEAQACGIPVIGSNSGGIPEGFIPDKSGFLVEEKNPEDIAKKIIFAAQNYDRIKDFGKSGRAFVEQSFNVHIEVKKLTELYKKNI